MDIVDRDLERAETDAESRDIASPVHSQQPAAGTRTDRRRASAGSASTSSSSGSSGVVREEINIASVNTSRDLERHPTALSRIETHRTQHSGTVGRSITSRKSTKPLPPFGGGKDYPPPLPAREVYVVEFNGPEDPTHPQNWPTMRKITLTAILAYTTFVSSFASSIFSAATEAYSLVFHVSSEVGTLGLSLYICGYATGPMLWAPLSELKGRKLPLVIAMFGFSVFTIGTATAKDIQTLLITRFFAGVCSSAPLAIVAAVFADIYSNKNRGIALVIFSMTVFCGPMLGPFIGGFIVINKHMGWRFDAYIPAFMGFLSVVLLLFFFQETYPPIVLVHKAGELRRRTRNWGIHAKQEEIEVDLRELVQKNFTRPLRLLFTEPIILLLSIYLSFIYALLYAFLSAYPYVFQRIHGFNPGVGGLPYFGLLVGMLLAGGFIILTQKSYVRKLEANGGRPVPEWRLMPMVVGGISFAGGLFWFGWTGYTKSIPWIVPTLSGLMTGFGILAVFIQGLNYLVDAYLMFAASAIAANTILRSLLAAVFPLWVQYMYDGIGINYSGTLLGCIAVCLIPIPVLFIKYGARIRERSKFAPTMKPKQMDDTDDEADAVGPKAG